MGVLVGINVCEFQAAGLKEVDLGGGFGFDFVGLNASDDHTFEKCAQLCVEAGGWLVDERGDVAKWQDRVAIDQDNMAAHSQGRVCKRDFDCVLGCFCARHERRAGKHACTMELNDGTVDADSKAKIIGIHNKTAHWASLSTEAAPPMR